MYILPVIMSLCDYLSVFVLSLGIKLNRLEALAEAFFNFVWPHILQTQPLLLVVSTSLVETNKLLRLFSMRLLYTYHYSN